MNENSEPIKNHPIKQPLHINTTLEPESVMVAEVATTNVTLTDDVLATNDVTVIEATTSTNNTSSRDGDITTTEVFNSSYDIVKSWIVDSDNLTMSTVSNLILRLIPLVQSVTVVNPVTGGNSRSHYKKLLAIALLRKLVQEYNYDSEDTRRTVLYFVDTTASTLIDSAIGLAKQSIDIGKIPVKSCCTIS